MCTCKVKTPYQMVDGWAMCIYVEDKPQEHGAPYKVLTAVTREELVTQYAAVMPYIGNHTTEVVSMAIVVEINPYLN